MNLIYDTFIFISCFFLTLLKQVKVLYQIRVLSILVNTLHKGKCQGSHLVTRIDVCRQQTVLLLNPLILYSR